MDLKTIDLRVVYRFYRYLGVYSFSGLRPTVRGARNLLTNTGGQSYGSTLCFTDSEAKIFGGWCISDDIQYEVPDLLPLLVLE